MELKALFFILNLMSKKNYYKHLLIFILLIVPLFTYSQKTISGKVITDDKEPAFSATIELLNNNILVTAVVVDDKGQFSFKDISNGTYKITIRRIGSKTVNKNITVDNKDIDFGEIILLDDFTELGEVTITAEKKIIEYKSDKTILNIKDTPLSKENSITEALTVLPGISSSDDGKQISVLGKQNVEVWVNGRKSNIKISEIPASIVNEIEIISNPSAKYDASIDAIIDLKLDKWKLQGLYGEVYLDYIQSRFPSYDGGLSLSYNKNKFSISTEFYYDNKKTFLDDFTTQQYLDFSPNISQTSQQNQIIKSNSTFGNINVNYALSMQETIGVDFEIDFYNQPEYLFNQNDSFFETLTPNTIDSTYTNKTLTNYKQRDYNAGINYINEFKKDKGNLKIAVDYLNSRFEEDNDYNFTETIVSNQNTTTSLFQKREDNDASILSSTIDVSLNIDDSNSIDFGGKVSVLSTDYNSNLQGDSQFIDENIIEYKFDETVYATYLNWSKSYEKIDFSIGLRGEYFDNDGEFNNSQSSQNSFDLFPSASFAYTISKKHKIVTSYSRKIKRVNFYQRSPFRFFVSPFSTLEGNPELQPQFSNSIEATYIYKRKYPFKIYYSKIDDYINQQVSYDGVNTIFKPINYEKESFGFSTSIPAKYTSWWKGIHKLTLSYDKEFGIIETVPFDNSIFRYGLYTKQYFNLWDWMDMSLTARYNSPVISGIYETEFNPFVHLDFSKTFLDDNLEVGISIRDIFNTYDQTITASFDNRNSYTLKELDIRKVGFSVSYYFGKGREVENKASDIIDEEKERINKQ